VVLAGCGAASGPIGASCVASGRPGATPALCGCVERVADARLSRADQRLAARFFRDPELAQSVRASDTAADDAFWERYTAFASEAERVCRPR
jgi:hypothetical protein